MIFFEIINDKKIMINHEDGHSRPTYFTIKDGDFLWFIPLSSRINKYQKEIDKKIIKYGQCRTIHIRKIAGRYSAILLQNAFPTLEQYISHVHTMKDGKPLKVIDSLKDEITSNFYYMISMKKEGIDLFFSDADEIKKILEKQSKNMI